MNISTALRAESKRHEAEVARIQHLLQVQLNLAPDNPRITRLGAGCFTMSSKDLGGVWSPQYHDFKVQYQALITLCGQDGNPRRKLLTALKTGQFKVSTEARPLKLHPDVIKNVRHILVGGNLQ